MSDETRQFYDDLASHYHLIFDDWDAAIERHGAALTRLIAAHTGPRPPGTPPLHLLDCSAGIGTQALALAGRGFAVHATDLSPEAIARAAAEAARRGIPLTTGVADLRHLDTQVEGQFDIVLSCDNALPHLLSDDDMAQAARAMRHRVTPDGLLLISVRNYDELLMSKPRATPLRIFDGPAGRRIVFQVWDWDDTALPETASADAASEQATQYTLTMFILQSSQPDAVYPGDSPNDWRVQTHTARYRAWPRAELNAIWQAAGWRDLRWHMPQDTGYFQPVLTARPDPA